MERVPIEDITLKREETNSELCPASQKSGDEEHSKQALSYARRLFPINVLVKVLGRKGIYRIVSEPYIPAGYSYPHFDVEALGERFCASVFKTARA